MASVTKMNQTEMNKLSSPFSFVKEMHISVHDGYVHIIAVVQSKSRPWMEHIVQAYVSKKGVVKASCDCEGFTFRKKCWHVQWLLSIINQDKFL